LFKINSLMKRELIENNPLLKLSIAFSLQTIEYCERLNAEKKFILANQLFRSATSIGANAMEAQNPESKADFIHKIKIAAKEADETQYWLLLCENSPNYPDPQGLSGKLEEINKILGSIIATAKRKTPFSYILSFFIF
jgi:four helix bundle protein